MAHDRGDFFEQLARKKTRAAMAIGKSFAGQRRHDDAPCRCLLERCASRRKPGYHTRQLPAPLSNPGSISTAELHAAHSSSDDAPDGSKPPTGVSGNAITRASGIA